jgi:hypothetical protein
MSWIIRNKATGEVLMETFSARLVAALNTAKYEAVPIRDYLAFLNHGCDKYRPGDIVSTR